MSDSPSGKKTASPRVDKEKAGNQSEPSAGPQQDPSDVNPINLFSSVFVSGLNIQSRRELQDFATRKLANATRHRESTSSTGRDIIQSRNGEDPTTKPLAANQEEEAHKVVPAFKIDDYIPLDPAELRETNLFKSTFQILQWQRDNYLVGTEYANWIKNHRDAYPDRTIDLPHDKNAMVHQQASKIVAWFIPTDTVRKALLPIVVDLPRTALYNVARNSIVDLIASQQANLDRAIKNALLSLTKSERNREAIKSSTQGYIQTTYRDSEDETNVDDPPKKTQ